MWVSWSSGLKCCLVWCPSRPAPCLLDVCVPSLSFSFVVWYGRRRRSCFFFLSFRRWGNPNPVWGLGFPLCSLPLGRRLRLRSVRLVQHIHLGIAPAPVFFVPSRRRRRRWFVGWYCGGLLRSCSDFFRFVVVGCCSGSVWSLFALHARCLRYLRPVQKDETSFAPCRVATMMVFWGFWVGTSDPHAAEAC